MKNAVSGGKNMNTPFRKPKKTISETRARKLAKKKLLKKRSR